MTEKIRCGWVDGSQIYQDYHDFEWGRPVHEDQKLFEMLLLETMQAGLAWITVLRKREAFQNAFDAFDAQKIACYDEAKIEELMGNAGIIRNRLKLQAAVSNAQAFLNVQAEYGSFDRFLWDYVENKPVVGHWKTLKDSPATTQLSDRLSKDLKKRGFKFVGSTTIYAYLQAVGLVNDHVADCFVYQEMMGN